MTCGAKFLRSSVPTSHTVTLYFKQQSETIIVNPEEIDQFILLNKVKVNDEEDLSVQRLIAHNIRLFFNKKTS